MRGVDAGTLVVVVEVIVGVGEFAAKVRFDIVLSVPACLHAVQPAPTGFDEQLGTQIASISAKDLVKAVRQTELIETKLDETQFARVFV